MEVPGGDEVETAQDSEPSGPRMGVGKKTQADETTKSKEQEVETQLFAEVSSVSLNEHEQGPGSRNGERDGSGYVFAMEMECFEIDNSPPNSPTVVDREVQIEDLTGESTPHGIAEPPVVKVEDTAPGAPTAEMEDSFDPGANGTRLFYGPTAASPRTYGNKKPRALASANLEGDTRGRVPPET